MSQLDLAGRGCSPNRGSRWSSGGRQAGLCQPPDKHATLAFVSVALLAAFALAGSAGSVGLPGKKDREAPTAPANVRVTSATPTSVSLAWEPAADNVAVDGLLRHVDALRARVSGTEIHGHQARVR